MKVEKIFGGKWLRVIDSVVSYEVAKKVSHYWLVPGFRVRGTEAPFGGVWSSRRFTPRVMVLIEPPKIIILK